MTSITGYHFLKIKTRLFHSHFVTDDIYFRIYIFMYLFSYIAFRESNASFSAPNILMDSTVNVCINFLSYIYLHFHFNTCVSARRVTYIIFHLSFYLKSLNHIFVDRYFTKFCIFLLYVIKTNCDFRSWFVIIIV